MSATLAGPRQVAPTIVIVSRAPSRTFMPSRCIVRAIGKLPREEDVAPAVLEALGDDREGHFEAYWQGLDRGWEIGRRVDMPA